MSVAHDVPVVPSQLSPGPSSSPPRTWLRRIAGGGQLAERCPSFCTDSHFNDDRTYLADLSHGTYFAGVQVPVFDAEHGTVLAPVLAGRISVDPYSSDPARNVPHVDVEPWQDEVMECLDPDDLAVLIAQVRAQADYLATIHAQLVAARAEHGQLA